MKRALITGSACLALAAACATVAADDAHHVTITPDQIKWAAAPPSLPPGAQSAVLYGDLSKPDPFAFRLKFLKDYHFPPHTHPKPEIVTVLSGTFHIGVGKAADKSKAKAMPAGSFFVMAPGMEHFAYADEGTIVQLNSVGPWGITYLDPNDDPRKK